MIKIHFELIQVTLFIILKTNSQEKKNYQITTQIKPIKSIKNRKVLY